MSRRVQQHGPGIVQVLHGIHLQALHHGGFLGIFRRHHQARQARIPRRNSQRQHAANPTHLAIQCQFAHKTPLLQPRRHLSFERTRHLEILLDGNLQAQGDGQVKTRPLLPHIGGSQVHNGDHLPRAVELTVAQRGTDAAGTLAHGGIRQADNGHGSALRRVIHIHLHPNIESLDAEHGCRMQARNHVGLPCSNVP